MFEPKSVTTPMEAHFKLSSTQSPQTKEDKEYMQEVPMQMQLVALCI